MFGLLGPNGAGKSTTVRVLVTLTHADEGTASVAGHDVRTEQNAVRRAIGYVPQDSGVDQFGTGRENLMLQGRVQGMSGSDLRGRTDELLELVGIADAADRIVKTLLRRHAPPARHRARARPPPARALPRRADDRPRPGGARRDVGRGVAARRGRVADDPAHDALPRGGRPARRPARDRLAGQGRRRGHAGRAEGGLRGDAVHVELENGAVDEAQRVLASVGAPPEQVLEGRTIVSRVENGGRALPGIISALEARGHRGRVGLAVAVRRSTTSTSTSPAATSRRRIAADDRLRHTWFMIVRQARNLMREPIWIVLLLVQPMVWLVLYGQLFRT